MLHWLCVKWILWKDKKTGMKNEEQLVSFVKKKLRSGYPEGELINDLLKDGYAAEEIVKAIYVATIGTADRSTKKKSDEKMSMWNLAGASLVILGISLNSVDTNFKQYGYFVLAAGILCLVVKYIISVKDEPKNE